MKALLSHEFDDERGKDDVHQSGQHHDEPGDRSFLVARRTQIPIRLWRALLRETEHA